MEYSNTFLIIDFTSFWMALIIHILSPFSIISLTLFYCCSKKAGKNGENPQGGGPGSGSGNSNASVAGKNSERNLEEIIKTDITQEETEITQEISNNGEPIQPGTFVEISPYPFEMFHRGFGAKKKKKHHHKQGGGGGGQNDRRNSATKKTRQHLHQQSPRRQHHKYPNEIDTVSTQTTHPRHLNPSEVVSKPISQKEKAEIKDKSHAKPSLDLPLGTDATQSTACSTQPSNLLLQSDDPNAINNNIPSSGDNINNNNDKN